MEDADNSDRKESLKQRSVCYFIMASVLGIVGAVFIVKGNAANSLLSQLDPENDFAPNGKCVITSVSHAVTEGITTETTSSTDGKTKSYSYAYCDDTYTYDFTWKVEGKPSQELVSETEEKRRGTQACKELMAKATACDPDYTTRNPDDCDPNSRSKEEICRETAYPYTFSGDTSLCRGLSPTGHSDATACKRACCEKEDCIICHFGGTTRKCWRGAQQWCNAYSSSAWMRQCCNKPSALAPAVIGGARDVFLPHVEASYSVGDAFDCWAPADGKNISGCANAPCVKLFEPAAPILELWRIQAGRVLLFVSGFFAINACAAFWDWRKALVQVTGE